MSWNNFRHHEWIHSIERWNGFASLSKPIFTHTHTHDYIVEQPPLMNMQIICIFYFWKLAVNAFVCRFVCVYFIAMHLNVQRKKYEPRSLFHTHFSYLAIKMYEDDPAASYTAYYQCDMLYLALIILITALLIKMAIHKPHTDKFTIQPTEREWGVERQVGSFHFCGLLGCHKNKSFLLPFSFSSA